MKLFKSVILNRITTFVLLLTMVAGMATALGKRASAASITITYDLNGGTVSPTDSTKIVPIKVNSGWVTIQGSTYYYPGKSIIGWATKKGGPKVYEPGQGTYLYNSITLYAIWGTKTTCYHPKYTETVVAQPSCNSTGKSFCKCTTCGATWYKTLSKTEHQYYVKDYQGYAFLRCSICEKRFFFDSCQKGLDDFAGYLYGKKFNQLSGSWSSGQKQNAAINWISYALVCSKADAKKLAKDYKGDLQVTINNVDKLIDFIGKCNTLAQKYGFTEAEAVAGILSKASFVTCMLNPSKTGADKFLVVLSKIDPTSSKILANYKKICEALITICLADHFGDMATLFESDCDKYGITFEITNIIVGTKPKQTPTFEELFEKNIKNGKTNLDRFCGHLLNDSSKDFKYVCAHKDTDCRVEYAYIMIWLVRPALDKKFSGLTDYSTILNLMKAAK